MAEGLARVLEHWKGILVSVGAILVILLQVVNALLTSLGHQTVEAALDQKTAALDQKAEQLQSLVERNRADLIRLHDELHADHVAIENGLKK